MKFSRLLPHPAWWWWASAGLVASRTAAGRWRWVGPIQQSVAQEYAGHGRAICPVPSTSPVQMVKYGCSAAEAGEGSLRPRSTLARIISPGLSSQAGCRRRCWPLRLTELRLLSRLASDGGYPPPRTCGQQAQACVTPVAQRILCCYLPAVPVVPPPPIPHRAGMASVRLSLSATKSRIIHGCTVSQAGAGEACVAVRLPASNSTARAGPPAGAGPSE